MIVRGEKNIKDQLGKWRDSARLGFYADIIVQMQVDLGCQIICVPVKKNLLPSEAALLTRVLCMGALPDAAAKNAVGFIAQHIIYFDETLRPVAAARLIAHDLFHIFKQRPENPKWDDFVDKRTGVIDYGPKLECLAEKFSLRLLKEHPFRVGATLCRSANTFIQMLDCAAPDDGFGKNLAWPSPDYMARSEAEDYIRELYKEM